DKRELKTLYKIQAGRRTAPPIRGDNPPGSCQISLLRDDTPAVPGHAAVRTESARQTRPAKHDCTEGDAVCTTGDAMSVPVVDTPVTRSVTPPGEGESDSHGRARRRMIPDTCSIGEKSIHKDGSGEKITSPATLSNLHGPVFGLFLCKNLRFSRAKFPSCGIIHRLDNLDFVEKSPRDILGQDKCPLARDVGHSRFFRTFANRYAPRPTGIFGCQVVFGGLSKKNPSIDF
ncbi:hypothetical protein J6590_047799, partial [Homalodisca vitripennis]